MIKIFLSLIVLVLIGCTNDYSESVIKKNKDTLSKEGTYIGTLPSRTKIYRYEISRGDSPSHYIYIADKSITQNNTKSNGKSSNNFAESLIED